MVVCKKGVGPSRRSRHSSLGSDLIGFRVGCIVLSPGCCLPYVRGSRDDVVSTHAYACAHVSTYIGIGGGREIGGEERGGCVHGRSHE